MIEEQEIEVSASLGITTFPDHGDTAERLMRNADVALIGPRQLGAADLSITAREMDQQLLKVRNLQRGLRHALAEGGLGLAYQPVFELPGQRLAKVEALLRWNHPGGGAIPPASFIPIAEASGLIHPHRGLGVAGHLPAGGDLARRWVAAQGRGQRLGGAAASGRVRGLGPRRSRRGDAWTRAFSSSS